MNQILKLILTLFLAPVVAIAGIAHANGDIVVVARESTATLAPRPAALELVNIPPLVFALRAAIRCRGDARSVTLSIADTARTLASEEHKDQWSAETTLTVPASQIALAASTRFCIAGDSESSDELLVPDLTTAHASLRCESDKGVSMHFASTQLQVRLLCQRPEVQVPSDPTDDR